MAGGFFAESDPFTLVMVLESSGTTLRNIKANPRVAVVVSSGNPFTAFLQGSADVSLVTEASEVQAVKAALLAKAPQIEPFLAAPSRQCASTSAAGGPPTCRTAGSPGRRSRRSLRDRKARVS